MKSQVIRSITFAPVIALWIGGATILAGALADEPSKDEIAAETRTVATAEAKAGEEKEFTPPPGFLKKKRGRFVVYCKRDSSIGTRIRTETCFDENQMRNYMLALQETKGDVDRIRAICSNPCACGQPEAC